MSRNTTADQGSGDGGLRSANAGAEAVEVMAQWLDARCAGDNRSADSYTDTCLSARLVGAS